MKIQFNGSSAVDVPGHDGVEPGQVIDVADEVGVSLLAAGTAYPDDGKPVAPDKPLWTPAGKKTAEAGKEGAA